MPLTNTDARVSIEQWTPTLFLVSGVLLVGHAAISGLRAFTDVATPVDVFGPVGFLLALVGLYGLYPELADGTPKLARSGAIVAAVPVVDYAVISASAFGQMVEVLPPISDFLPAVFFVLHLGAMTLAYALFGVATLRTETHPRPISFLLLAPPVLIVVQMASAAIVENPAVGAFLVGSALAVVHLAIGYSLKAGSGAHDHGKPTGDVNRGMMRDG
jgi:hypothetical protein